MNILSMDSSAKSASSAYLKDGMLAGQFYINSGLTHSTTLMPMTENLLNIAGLSLDDVDFFAVSCGPGSFTGLRIGIAAVKGMALAENKPCVAVSTLEAIAYGFVKTDRLICSLIDARCKRFFCAFFRCTADGDVKRLTDDKALSYEEISDIIKRDYSDEKVIFAGDGAEAAYSLMKDITDNIDVAPLHICFQQSVGVAMAAEKYIKLGKAVSSQQLVPIYLSLPQAQRELQKKQGSK